MYESEVNDRREDGGAIPGPVRKQWSGLGRGITARSVIPWGEHCTECAIPHCFLTCDLYEKRGGDLSCRRFTEGMVRVTGVAGIVPWLIKIRFKKWGKLWAHGSIGMLSLAHANRIEKLNASLGTVIRMMPMAIKKPLLIPWRYRSLRNKWVKRRKSRESPNYFLMEIYNPGTSAVGMTFYIRSRRQDSNTPFAAPIIVAPGLQRWCFPVETIRRYVNLDEEFHLEISPSNSEATPLLYFGCMDFVRDGSYKSPEKAGGCKCVVWDLDNTVWNGILVEDGADGVTLKPGIKEVFAELDRRGILLSVASKNNLDDVMPVLRRFGLDEYILKPQVSWGPKGQAVRKIAELLNIGIDSLIYVDDSPFERAEVSAVCPEVLVIDETEAIWLPWREECQVASTDESAHRRLYYREQNLREEAYEQAAGDYEAFLRECNIRVRILALDESLLPRVHELAQRTNQMNFSGTRYTREQLAQLWSDGRHDIHVIEVNDRFGSYGIVGLAVMDRAQGVLTDLAFSCRIQSKRIEHALLAFLLRRYPARPFHARWRKTDRNAPAGMVFADLGFREVRVIDGVTELEFDDKDVPRFDFITLEPIDSAPQEG